MGYSVGSAQNLYRVGDVLLKQQIGYTPCSEYEGRGLIWTMPKPKDSKIYKVKIIANRDTSYLAALSKIEAGTNYLYDVRHDTLLCMGYKNKRAHIKYMMPLPCLRSPIRYGEECGGRYYGQGIDNKESFVRIFGNYQTKVSGEGTLITIVATLCQVRSCFVRSIPYRASLYQKIASCRTTKTLGLCLLWKLPIWSESKQKTLAW